MGEADGLRWCRRACAESASVSFENASRDAKENDSRDQVGLDQVELLASLRHLEGDQRSTS